MNTRRLALGTVLGFLAGCVAPIKEQAGSFSANATVLASEEGSVVQDNLSHVSQIRSDVGLHILDTLKKFERAYEAGDRHFIQSLLSKSFRLIRTIDDKERQILDPVSFMSEIGQPIDFSFSHLKRSADNNFVLAVARTRTKGKWFSTSELMVFLFHRNTPGQIEAITSTPYYSEPYPAGGVSILVNALREDFEFVRQWPLRAINLHAADRLIDSLASSQSRFISRNESPYSVVAVFKEPLMPGSRVTFEHRFQVAGEWLQPYVHRYAIQSYGKFHIVQSSIRSGSPPGTVIGFRVFVNGKLVAERTIPSGA